MIALQRLSVRLTSLRKLPLLCDSSQALFLAKILGVSGGTNRSLQLTRAGTVAPQQPWHAATTQTLIPQDESFRLKFTESARL